MLLKDSPEKTYDKTIEFLDKTAKDANDTHKTGFTANKTQQSFSQTEGITAYRELLKSNMHDPAAVAAAAALGAPGGIQAHPPGGIQAPPQQFQPQHVVRTFAGNYNYMD